MDENILDWIGQLAETLDNALFASQNMPLPPQIHLQGLSGTMKEVRDELVKVYEKNGGTEKLNIQAK